MKLFLHEVKGCDQREAKKGDAENCVPFFSLTHKRERRERTGNKDDLENREGVCNMCHRSLFVNKNNSPAVSGDAVCTYRAAARVEVDRLVVTWRRGLSRNSGRMDAFSLFDHGKIFS